MTRSLFYYVLLILLVGLFACQETTPSGEVKPTAEIPVGTGNPAIDGLTAQIAKSPKQANLYAARAEIFYENDDFEMAIQDIKQAIALDSTKPNYYHVLADLYLDTYQSKDALETMETTAKLFPYIPTLLKLSEFQYLLKQYNKSIQTIEQILKKEQRHPEGLFMLGLNFKEMGDTSKALASFQTCVEEDPEHLDAYLQLGLLADARGSYLAEQYFDNALRIDSTSIDALHGKAFHFQNKNRFKDAIQLYKKINTIDPQYTDAYLNSGLLYLELREADKADKQFEIATKMDPTFIQSYYYRGIAAEMKGNNERAVALYKQALLFDRSFKPAMDALEALRTKQ